MIVLIAFFPIAFRCGMIGLLVILTHILTGTSTNHPILVSKLPTSPTLTLLHVFVARSHTGKS